MATPFVEGFPNAVPPLAERTASIVRMLEVEAALLAQLHAEHGIVGTYSHLAGVNVLRVTSLFRTTGDDVAASRHAAEAHDWDALSKYPANFRFFAGLPASVVPDQALMHDLVATRKQLVAGNMRLIVKQVRQYVYASKTRRSVDDLVGLAVLGWLEGVDKYTPGNKPVAVRAFNAVCLGRMSGELSKIARTGHALHLHQKEAHHLVNLRAGRVENPTADDMELMRLDDPASFDRFHVGDDGETGLDGFIADPAPSALDMLIAREEALSVLPAPRPAGSVRSLPSGSTAPIKPARCGRRGKAVQCVETGVVYPTGLAAVRAFGGAPSTSGNLSQAIKHGGAFRGHHFRFVEQSPAPQTPKEPTHMDKKIVSDTDRLIAIYAEIVAFRFGSTAFDAELSVAEHALAPVVAPLLIAEAE
jgi:hypothetical protein